MNSDLLAKLVVNVMSKDSPYPGNEKYKAHEKYAKNVDKVYAVYKGDAFVDVGTVSEICKNQGWTRSYFSWLKGRGYQNRGNKGNRLEIFELEEDDDE